MAKKCQSRYERVDRLDALHRVCSGFDLCDCLMGRGSEKRVIWAIVAFCGGSLSGVIITALMVAASDADDEMERLFNKEEK